MWCQKGIEKSWTLIFLQVQLELPNEETSVFPTLKEVIYRFFLSRTWTTGILVEEQYCDLKNRLEKLWITCWQMLLTTSNVQINGR